MKSYKLYELVLFCIPKYKPLLGMSIEKKGKHSSLWQLKEDAPK